MGNLIGYARVSTGEQSSASQEAELRDAGCVRVFVDRGESIRAADRPEWGACLDYLRPGDTLAVRALDRIAASEVVVIEILNELGRRGVSIKSLTEPPLNIDVSTTMGKAIVGIMSVLVQLRVDAIRENTHSGLAFARSQGRVGGRPPAMTDEKLRIAIRMSDEGKGHRTIAQMIGVGKSTVTRHLDRARVARADVLFEEVAKTVIEDSSSPR